MALKRGNSIALQALRPSEFKVADFIDDKITNYIKDGRAAEAARIKRLQDEGKQLIDLNKDIKVDALGTISALQPALNGVNKEAMDSLAYAGRIANNYNIPYAERAEAYRVARAKADSLVLLGKHLSDPNFIKSYNEKLATDPATIFEGDDTLQFINSIKNGQIKLSFDKNGNPLVAYPNQNQTPEEKVEWKDFSDLAMRLGQGFEKDLSGDIEDLAKKQASNMYSKFEENKSGNVKISGTKFLKDEANTSFEATFGGYDINNKDPYLKQFSYEVLGKKFISNEEDYKKVKDAWVNKLESYTPKESSYVVEKSAAELRNLDLRNRNLERDLNRPDPSLRQQEIVQPLYSNGESIVQIRDSSGRVKGTQTWAVNSVSLPKLKGKPATDNSFGLSTFVDSKGVLRKKYLMGAPAENGRMVYSPIEEKDLKEYVSKLGYNPIEVKRDLDRVSNNNRNRYSGVVNKDNIYNSTKINFKSRDVKDEDDQPLMLVQPVRSNQ